MSSVSPCITPRNRFRRDASASCARTSTSYRRECWARRGASRTRTRARDWRRSPPRWARSSARTRFTITPDDRSTRARRNQISGRNSETRAGSWRGAVKRARRWTTLRRTTAPAKTTKTKRRNEWRRGPSATPPPTTMVSRDTSAIDLAVRIGYSRRITTIRLDRPTFERFTISSPAPTSSAWKSSPRTVPRLSANPSFASPCAESPLCCTKYAR